MLERGERERLRLQRQIVSEILLAPRHAAATGSVRHRQVPIVMKQARIRETNVEPRRVERRRSRHRSLELREERIQVLEGAQIQRRNINVEVVECGEGRKKNVELALAAGFGYRARHMSIFEDERRLLHLEMIERAARRSHGAGDVSLPVVRERLAVQGAQQIEIDRRRLELDVLDRQHFTARLERHVSEQPRSRRPHIHVAEHVVEELRVPQTADVELQLAAARRRQRRIYPGHIGQRYRIADDVHVVAHRQIASPDDAAVTLTRRTGKVEVIGVDEDRIAKIQSRPRDVAELERRIRLGEAELPDSHQSADSIGIGDAGEAEVRLRLRPPPRAREALTRSSDLVIGAVQLVPDGAVEFRSAQRIGRMPRQRQ